MPGSVSQIYSTEIDDKIFLNYKDMGIKDPPYIFWMVVLYKTILVENKIPTPFRNIQKGHCTKRKYPK